MPQLNLYTERKYGEYVLSDAREIKYAQCIKMFLIYMQL